MSFFDLSPVASANVLEQARMHPVTADDLAPSLMSGTLTAVPRGLASVATDVNLLGSGAIAEAARGPAKAIDEQLGTDLTSYVQAYKDGALAASKAVGPDPMTDGKISQIVQGFFNMAPEAMGGFMAGGPGGAAAVVGTLQGYKGMRMAESQGVDPATAIGMGTLEGGAAAIGAVLPASRAGAGFLSNLVFGAGVNVATGAAQRGAVGSFLEARGYHDMAAQYHALDAKEAMWDAVLGVGFGAWGHVMHGAVKPADLVRPSDIDAALAAGNQHHFELGTAPGIPTDMATRQAHIDAVSKAVNDLMAGEPVDVHQANKGISDGNFEQDPRTGTLKVEIMRAVDEHLGADFKVLQDELARRGMSTDTEQYSRGQGAGDSVAVIASAARESFGKHTGNLMDSGTLKVVETVDELPARADGQPHPADTKAVFDGQTVHIVAGNVAPGEVKGVVLHEVGAHYGMEQLLGGDGYRRLLSEIDAKARSGDIDFAAALAQVPKDTPAGQVKAETLAYLVQNRPDLPLVKRLISQLKTAIYRVTGGRLVDLNADDIRTLAVAALKRVSSAEAARTGDTLYSRAGKIITDSPAFKRWFGNSKVVDAEGKPLLVYHGTDQSFDEFRGNSYFTPLPEDASKYSFVNTPGKDHTPNVMPVYLSLQKPKIIDFYATRADIDDARQAGFDGVIVRGVGGSKVNHYIAFDSKQIKSAFNQGTFDPNNPNIMYARGSSVDYRTGKEKLDKFGLVAGNKYTTREIAAAMEARQRAKIGTIARDDFSDETAKKIGKWMVEEVAFAHEQQKSGSDSGVGWYSEKYQRALDHFAEVFPELKDNQGKRDFFTSLVAIMSDGQKVFNNFTYAARMYEQYRTTGKLPTDITFGGERSTSMNMNMRAINDLVEKFGEDGMGAFLQQEFTVSQLSKMAKESGVSFSSAYKADTRLPMAALVFGPKLGAFYANLMGAHGYLTMDRWWSRTFNRYRGQLLTSVTGKADAPTNTKGELLGLARFKDLIKEPNISDEEALTRLEDYKNAYEAKGFKNGTEIEKAANTLYKDAFVNMEDAPFNASDREFMIKAVNQAQKMLKKKGIDLSIADIQAVLWYYEKRLYGELGARQSADVSYEEAARRVVSEHGSGPDGWVAHDNAEPVIPGPDGSLVEVGGSEPGAAGQEAQGITYDPAKEGAMLGNPEADKPAITAMEQIARDNPDLEVPMDDGNLATIDEALAKADEEIATATKDAAGFDAAAACALRG